MSTPLTTTELAALLGVTERTVQRKARHREIPHLRIGRLIRFTEQHVQQIMQAYEREALRERPEARLTNPLYQPMVQNVVPLASPRSA